MKLYKVFNDVDCNRKKMKRLNNNSKLKRIQLSIVKSRINNWREYLNEIYTEGEDTDSRIKLRASQYMDELIMEYMNLRNTCTTYAQS